MKQLNDYDLNCSSQNNPEHVLPSPYEGDLPPSGNT
jgi:hypothetical protein